MAGTGMYRDCDGIVWMVAGSIRMPMTKDAYTERELQPPYDKLPTKEQYEAAQSEAARATSPVWHDDGELTETGG